MGYNTVVIVMNDALDQIAKDPDFGKNLAQKIQEFHANPRSWSPDHDVSSGHNVNAATVCSVEHADVTVLLAAGGNHASILYKSFNGGRHHKKEDQWDLLEQAYEQAVGPDGPGKPERPDVAQLRGDNEWGQHPEFTREAWQTEIAAGNVQSGYWEWVTEQLDQQEEDSLHV